MAVITAAGQGLAEAAETRLDQPVPSCPDWTMADLVFHLGRVQGTFHGLGTGTVRPEDITAPERPPDAELIDWFRAGVASLVDGLGAQDPAAERWNWTGVDQTAGWIQRRMAQEAALHAWDGRQAVGFDEPVAADVAADGIDEFLDVFVGVTGPAFTGPTRSIHLHVTGDAAPDEPGEWLLSFGEGTTQLDRVHAKGDVALRGPASDLLLVLWGRRSVEVADVVGDASVVDLLLESARF